ncbi:MAG: LysR family transcriptional regulator [Betaproteobacteria bacterium]|nr:LysR family transcriptional regulator [Betaproteobacteria bacterium]
MELRQLRYFVRVVELGSMSRAALDLNLVQSALSQQITRLEGELCTRLLQRSPQGVTPTEAGVAFYREAQLSLRHAEQAVRSAQQARLTGSVTIGLAPTTAAMLGLPLMQAMRLRYPDVRLHMVESMSGHLADMLNARQLDLAVLFDAHRYPGGGAMGRRWQVQALLEEDLYLIRPRPAGVAAAPQALPGAPLPALLADVRLASMGDEPLILPTGGHGLRSTLDAAFARAKRQPKVVMEVDSLSMLMAAVEAGLGSTIQPWAALGRQDQALQRFAVARIADKAARRTNLLCSLSEDELSPAALAARVVLRDCAAQRLGTAQWPGTRLGHHES